jgi:hypothetical protein
MTFICDAIPEPALPASPPDSPASGSASARESRFAMSLLDGRRRLRGFLRDFSILETKLECFIWRLSRFDVLKESSSKGEEGEMDEAGFTGFPALAFGRTGA